MIYDYQSASLDIGLGKKVRFDSHLTLQVSGSNVTLTKSDGKQLTYTLKKEETEDTYVIKTYNCDESTTYITMSQSQYGVNVVLHFKNRDLINFKELSPTSNTFTFDAKNTSLVSEDINEFTVSVNLDDYTQEYMKVTKAKIKVSTTKKTMTLDEFYELIMNDIEISFDELDKIARNKGYELNDERRIEALTINMIKVLTFNNGDTYLYFDEMYEYMKKHTDNIEEDTFEYILLKLSKKGKIFIDKNKYYLYEHFEAETYIADRLTKLNDMPRRKLPKLETKIKVLEDANNIVYDPSQKEAITKSLNNNLTF